MSTMYQVSKNTPLLEVVDLYCLKKDKPIFIFGKPDNLNCNVVLRGITLSKLGNPELTFLSVNLGHKGLDSKYIDIFRMSQRRLGKAYPKSIIAWAISFEGLI